MRPNPNTIETEAIAFFLCIAATLVFGVVSGIKSARKSRRADWVTFGFGLWIIIAFLTPIIITTGRWLKWKQWDNFVASEARSGTLVSIVPDRDYDIYNIKFSPRHTARYNRFHFSIDEGLPQVAMLAMVLGFLRLRRLGDEALGDAEVVKNWSLSGVWLQPDQQHQRCLFGVRGEDGNFN